MDKETEEVLNVLEKKFREYNEIMSVIYWKLKEQICKYNNLHNLTGDFMRSFEYHLDEEQRKKKFFTNFGDSGKSDQNLLELKKIMQVFSDIVYFFKRKRSFYEKYKKMKLKNLDQQTHDGTVTVNNQKELLNELERDILEYNQNLKGFLEGHPIIQKTLDACVEVMENIVQKLTAL